MFDPVVSLAWSRSSSAGALPVGGQFRMATQAADLSTFETLPAEPNRLLAHIQES